MVAMTVLQIVEIMTSVQTGLALSVFYSWSQTTGWVSGCNNATGGIPLLFPPLLSLSSPPLTWDSEISSCLSACPYSQQGGTCHLASVRVCARVLRRATHNDESGEGWGWQGSDLSDREIATWFKWLACSRQSLDRRVNWLLSYLQSNVAVLTRPGPARLDLDRTSSLTLFLSVLPQLKLYLALRLNDRWKHKYNIQTKT